MCGLLQIVTRNAPVNEAVFSEALSTLRHRGPDAEGVQFVRAELETAGGRSTFGIGFGHRRLSIIDLDPRSNQPFRQGSKTLLYNGEIYNFAHLKAGLPGIPFRTTGDTEVLLTMVAEKGVDALSDMSGMWAFVVTDEATGEIVAARDRYGKKPLFYYLDKDKLILSSSIGAIAALCGRRPSIRPDFLDSYLAHGVAFPGGDQTTYLRDIMQVPPGGYLRFDMRTWGAESGPWFNLGAHVRSHPPDRESLPEIIRTAVVSRLVSDRGVGLLLSGGIDSSLLLSAIHSEGLQDGVHCFIGETGRSEDAAYARQCADKLGIKAHVVDLSQDPASFDHFLGMCRHQEKPFPLLGNSMAMAKMYEKIAGFDVSVVLDGTGGDEIFGGYWDRQYPFAIRDALASRDVGWLRDAAMRNGALFWRGVRAMGAREVNLRRLLRHVAVHPGLSLERFCRADVLRAPSLDPLSAKGLSFADALLADIEAGRLGEWIWQNDRNAMMASIENRSPLLDVRLAAFAATGYAPKFVGPWSKHELRQAFDSLTPLPTQWRRQKQGFRWNARQFYHQNAARIMEVIAASRILPERVDVRAFLDAARGNRRYLASRLCPRLLAIAGLEQTIGLELS